MFIVRQVEDASSVPTGIAHFASGTLSPNTVHEAYKSYVIRSCVCNVCLCYKCSRARYSDNTCVTE